MNENTQTSQPTITPTPPISPVYPISKSKNNAVMWIAPGAVILTIGIGIGLMLGKYSPKQISSYEECVKVIGNQTTLMFPGTCTSRDGRQFTQPLTEEEKKKLLSPDPTASWKTYIDGRFNFSVKYPGEWNTLPFPDNWEPGAWLILAYSPDSKTSSIEGKISGVVAGKSTTFIVSAYNKSQVTVKNLEKLALGKNSEKTEQTINQIKGLLIVNEERTEAVEKLFVFEKEDYTFVVQLFWRKGKPEDEKTLDQILSTFRFLGTLDKNYLYLMRFNRDKPPPDSTRYIKNKDIIMEFPEEVTVRNEPIYAQGAIISDANVTIDDNTYYLSNLMGFPHGRYDRCYDEYYSGAESSEENCVFQFETGSPVSVLRWVSDEKGVFLLNIQDIKIETYHIDNFTIYKGPINQNTPPGKAYVQGRFTKEEIQKWIGLVKNVKAVPVSN